MCVCLIIHIFCDRTSITVRINAGIDSITMTPRTALSLIPGCLYIQVYANNFQKNPEATSNLDDSADASRLRVGSCMCDRSIILSHYCRDSKAKASRPHAVQILLLRSLSFFFGGSSAAAVSKLTLQIALPTGIQLVSMLPGGN